MKLCSSPGMYTSDETISKENQLVRLLIFFRLWSFIGSILLPYYHVAKEAIDWACLDLVLRPFLHIGWNLPPFTMFDYNCERTKVFISWYMKVRRQGEYTSILFISASSFIFWLLSQACILIYSCLYLQKEKCTIVKTKIAMSQIIKSIFTRSNLYLSEGIIRVTGIHILNSDSVHYKRELKIQRERQAKSTGLQENHMAMYLDYSASSHDATRASRTFNLACSISLVLSDSEASCS